MVNLKTLSLYHLLPFAFLFTTTFGLQAAEIIIEPSGQQPSTQFVVKTDKIEMLAGMKLVLTYPKEYLKYKEAHKGDKLNSFMHVINDKTPGKLVLVMASASGISGEDIVLFKISFEKVDDTKEQYDLSPTNCELMSEMLEPIECKITSSGNSKQ